MGFISTLKVRSKGWAHDHAQLLSTLWLQQQTCRISRCPAEILVRPSLAMEENQLSSLFIFVWVPILENDGNVCLDCLGDPLLEAIMYIMGLAHRYGKLSQSGGLYLLQQTCRISRYTPVKNKWGRHWP